MRRIDILAVDKKTRKGFMIPGLEMEPIYISQRKLIRKRRAYMNQQPYMLKENIHGTINLKLVYFFGSRGMLNKKYLQFRKTFKIPKKPLTKL